MLTVGAMKAMKTRTLGVDCGLISTSHRVSHSKRDTVQMRDFVQNGTFSHKIPIAHSIRRSPT